MCPTPRRSIPVVGAAPAKCNNRCALFEQYFVAAYLLDAPRNAVTVHRPHGQQSLQHHHVQRALQ